MHGYLNKTSLCLITHCAHKNIAHPEVEPLAVLTEEGRLARPVEEALEDLVGADESAVEMQRWASGC